MFHLPHRVEDLMSASAGKWSSSEDDALGTNGKRRGFRRVTGLLTAMLAALPMGLTALPSGVASAITSCAGNGITATSLNPPVFYTDVDPTPELMSGYAGYSVTSTSARKNMWVKVSNFSGGALSLASGQPGTLPLGDLGANATVPAFFMLTASGVSPNPQTHTVEVYAGNPATSGATLLCTLAGGFSSVDDTIQAAANKVQDIDSDGVAVRLSTAAPRLGGTVTVTVEGNTGTIGAGTAGDPNGVYMTPSALANFPAGSFRLTGTALRIRPNDTATSPQTFTNLLRLGSLGSSARDYVATYTFTVTGTTSSSTSLYPIQQIASGTQIKHTNTANFATDIPAIPPVTNPLTVAMSAGPTSFPASGGVTTVTQTLSSVSSSVSQVDSLVSQLPAGATYVPGTAKLNGISVADPAVDGTMLTFSGPFDTSVSAPGVLRYDVSVPPVLGSYAISGYGLLAGTVIDTSVTTADSSPATATINVLDANPQTVTFPALSDATMGDAAPSLGATADSGLPVSYVSTTPSVCAVDNDTVSLVAPGTCTVVASQAGDSSYAAAPDVARSFTVHPAVVPPSPQTITFPPVADTAWNAPAPVLGATADSGLPVSYTSSTPAVCTVNNGAVSLVAPGTCTLTAASAEDVRYLPAHADRSFSVTRAGQRIDFAPLADTALSAPAPTVTATAESGLPVLLSAGPPSTCSVVSGGLTLLDAGTCTVSAAQPGDDRWLAAPSVDRSFQVQAIGQVITFPALTDTPIGQPAPTLSATSDAGLPITYTSSTPTVCTVSGTRLNLAGPGQCTVTATQPGDATHAPAVPVDRSFQVRLLSQSIDFPAMPGAVLTRSAPVPSATSSAGLPITYTTTTPSVCTVSGTAVTMVSTGSCTLVAAQPGDATHAAATTVARSFTVQAPPPLTVTPVGTATTGTIPGAVDLPGLPAGAVLSVPPDAATTVAGVGSVHVTGHHVVVVAKATFSGVITLPVTVRADGQTRVTTVRVVVVPNPALVPTSGLANATRTAIAWRPSPNAHGYEVRLANRVVCVTTSTSCTTPGLLGPKAALTVTALGGAGTRSVLVRPTFRATSLVRVASVYFASDSAALSSAARQTLDRVAATMRTQGFGRLQLVGNTDSRASYLYNLTLSRKRAEAVEAYVRARLTGTGVRLSVEYRSESQPVASNATAAGRALNRRTDVSLG